MSMVRPRLRWFQEWLASRVMLAITLFAGLLVLVIIFALYLRARPILDAYPMSALFSSAWHPSRGEFGLRPFILGTLWVTALAMVLAVPPCLLVAIYLAEYAHERLRMAVKPLIDLLAGIPSVVYGMWGVLFVIPLVKEWLIPFAREHLAGLALFSTANSSGYSVLAGGIVLAVMVFPLIISVSEEVLRAVPQELREASLALGATRWETIKHVVLRKALPGVGAAIILGFSRALGETMAVLMVVGNVAKSPASVFDPAYPLPALIANSYGEMMSVPLYDSALLLAALVLLLIVWVFTVLARIALLRAIRRAM